jgi:hypothetical protein
MAIKLSTLLGALGRGTSEAAITLELPDGSSVPAHFHVTEVGRVRKDFIDCGGTTRSWSRCVLQAWVADDVDHRISPDKLAKIIQLAAPILGGDDLEVDVEYDLGVITQLPVVSMEPDTNGGLRLRLGGKHTACLAPDRCGVPASESASGAASGCCGGNGASTSAPVSLGVRR